MITAAGRVGRIEHSQTKDGRAMSRGSMACEYYSSSERGRVTDWWGFVAFGEVAERMSRANVEKGSAVQLCGEVHLRPPWGKDGQQPNSQAEIVVGAWAYLPTGQDAQQPGGQRAPQKPAPQQRPAQQQSRPAAQSYGNDDDIPF